MISVAADLAGVHPQTLRIYERKQLINPQRSGGNTRLYSEADIDRLRLIQSLTQDEGVNLAGVIRIMDMQCELEHMRDEVEALRAQLRRVERERLAAEQERHIRNALVRVHRGTVMRHSGER
jgi:MerR family transcriptional regulator/heat shock protein HspR